MHFYRGGCDPIIINISIISANKLEHLSYPAGDEKIPAKGELKPREEKKLSIKRNATYICIRGKILLDERRQDSSSDM